VDADVPANECRDTERIERGKEMKKDEIVEIAKAVGIKYNPVLQEFHSEFCNGLNLEDLEEFIKVLKSQLTGLEA
jgi:hypothetical protein